MLFFFGWDLMETVFPSLRAAVLDFMLFFGIDFIGIFFPLIMMKGMSFFDLREGTFDEVIFLLNDPLLVILALFSRVILFP